jgi:FHS family Na+ dependent glucose MFS transporter 1
MPQTVTQDAQAASKLIGYYAVIGGLGLGTAVLGPTLSGLAAQTGSTLSEFSILFVLGSLGYLSGTLLAGRLYDQRPGHPLMALAVLVSALGLGLIPLAPWLWLLVIVNFGLGLAQGSLDVGSNTLLVWVYRDRVGPYMNGLHFAFGVGAFLSPLIVAQALAWSGGIAWAYWTLALLIAPAAFWIMRLPSPEHRAAAREAQNAPVKWGVVGLLVLCFFAYVGAEVGFGAWVYTYANRLGLADETMAAYLTSAFWGALTAGRLLSIPLAARLRPRLIMAINLAGCVLSVGLALFFPASSLVIWISALGTGLFMASIFPTLLNMAGRRMVLTARVSSLFFVGSSLGGMFFPWLIGQLFEPVGPHVTMVVIFAGVLLNVAAYVALLAYAPRPVADGRR